MRQSKAEIYFHFVWATKQRLPTLTPEIEREVYRCIQGEAQTLGCDVLALNGMSDHVHLLVKSPTRLAPAKIMAQVKGVSSRFVHENLPQHGGLWWQEGYGVFSIGRNQRRAVIAYIENQKAHHTDNTVQADWEEVDEEYVPRNSRA